MIKRIKKLKTEEKGFTLMEVLVSASVFVIIVIAALSVYSSVLKANQKTIALTRVQREIQFTIQVLSKKIRTSVVKYSYYDGVSGEPGDAGEVTILVLTDAVGDDYYFKQINGGLGVAVNATSPEEDGEYMEIPAENVTIENLSFYINPTSQPFSLDAPPSSQPYVMLVLEVTSSQALQTASLNIQQVVPQRSGGY